MRELRVYPVRVVDDPRNCRVLIVAQDSGEKLSDGFTWRPTPLVIVPDSGTAGNITTMDLARLIADHLDAEHAAGRLS